MPLGDEAMASQTLRGRVDGVRGKLTVLVRGKDSKLILRFLAGATSVADGATEGCGASLGGKTTG